MARSANSCQSKRAAALTEETIDNATAARYDAFLREYVKDFCCWKASVRFGVTPNAGYLMSRTAYFQKKLYDTVRTLQTTDIVHRNEVLAGLLEEAHNQKAFPSDRISAWNSLGKMLGMDRTVQEVKAAPVGVMLVPVMSADDWEATAAKAQEFLKATVASS